MRKKRKCCATSPLIIMVVMAGEIPTMITTDPTTRGAGAATGKAEGRQEAARLSMTTHTIQTASGGKPDSKKVAVVGEMLISIKLLISTETTARASVSRWSSP